MMTVCSVKRKKRQTCGVAKSILVEFQLCGRTLSCGNHTCEIVCHSGSCGDCPRAGMRTCPCGKTGNDQAKMLCTCCNIFAGKCCVKPLAVSKVKQKYQSVIFLWWRKRLLLQNSKFHAQKMYQLVLTHVAKRWLVGSTPAPSGVTSGLVEWFVESVSGSKFFPTSAFWANSKIVPNQSKEFVTLYTCSVDRLAWNVADVGQGRRNFPATKSTFVIPSVQSLRTVESISAKERYNFEFCLEEVQFLSWSAFWGRTWETAIQPFSENDQKKKQKKTCWISICFSVVMETVSRVINSVAKLWAARTTSAAVDATEDHVTPVHSQRQSAARVKGPVLQFRVGGKKSLDPLGATNPASECNQTCQIYCNFVVWCSLLRHLIGMYFWRLTSWDRF